MSLSMMKRRIKGKEVEWVGVRIEPYIEMLKRLYENKTASYKPGFPIDPEETQEPTHLALRNTKQENLRKPSNKRSRVLIKRKP